MFCVKRVFVHHARIFPRFEQYWELSLTQSFLKVNRVPLDATLSSRTLMMSLKKATERLSTVENRTVYIHAFSLIPRDCRHTKLKILVFLTSKVARILSLTPHLP